MFDVIVWNTLYSIKWLEDIDSILINEKRFESAEKLASKSCPDYAFIMHSNYTAPQILDTRNGGAFFVS
ncbi:N-6 DNA methylase [Streptobacillus moniliformis]|uniref:N-6 DNA methylase n=1 Tax=Streptobacillus moniliformis TaxID=34105 RepID=UPI0039C4596E